MPVFFLGTGAARLTPILLGFAAGAMGIASFVGVRTGGCQQGFGSKPRTGQGHLEEFEED
ncbi:MAG TPA: hypothetical protein VFY04_06035 [Solirubrobacterales bacterium]|nr:hypothetical protein [Solirubrobacterales bacterium]